MTATSRTITERILETLRTSRRTSDDDELARRLGVTQRQTVNQICRRLASDGRLQRHIGDTGKLVNVLRKPQPATQAVGAPAPTDLASSPIEGAPGSSAEQQEAEVLIVAYASKILGVDLRPQRIMVSSGARVAVDGADDDCSVLVEAWGSPGAIEGRAEAQGAGGRLQTQLDSFHVADATQARAVLFRRCCR